LIVSAERASLASILVISRNQAHLLCSLASTLSITGDLAPAFPRPGMLDQKRRQAMPVEAAIF
jgi:hypothetical protein